MYLLLIAVAPAAGLLLYVWNKDKSQKEPPGFLFLLLGLGAAASIPTVIVELIAGKALDAIFVINENSTFESDGIWYLLWALCTNFFGIALVEEGFKFLFMFFVTKNSRHFDSLFDGMIYSIFVSLGFAALENILYVFDGGVGVAITRALMAVPGHMFFAVFMGYYYSLWHLYRLADKAEAGYERNGLIVRRPPKFLYKPYLVAAIVIPVLVHGFYDFCLTMDSVILVVAVLLMMVGLYIICFRRIQKMSKADLEDCSLVPLILCAKYPELVGVVSSKSVAPTYSNLKVKDAVAVATKEREEKDKAEAAAKMAAWQQYQQQYAQYTPYAPQYPQYQQMPPQPQYPQYQQAPPPQPQIPQYAPQPQNPFFYQPTNPQYQQPPQQPQPPENPFYYQPK